jgi:hypothetical protein
MIIQLPRHQAEAILGAMRAVAQDGGLPALTEADRATIDAAGTIVFGFDDVDMDALSTIEPDGLARQLASRDNAEQAVRMLAVMSLADGVQDPEKTARVRAYADALDVHDGYLDILAAVAADEITQASACIMRKNVASFPHLDPARLADGPLAPFLPYRDAPDPELHARYQGLGELPAESFGRHFYSHFESNGFAFPGDPNGLAEGFTTPHDSSHVLTGYSTSPAGEVCVSTFIGAMHPDHPMAAEVLPVLYSWHLGIRLNDVAGSYRGAYEPHRFWTAWKRGAATTVDVVAPDWDFWQATTMPLDQLRDDYGIPAAAASMLI